ncbi:hypothetical protein NKH61_31585 [Mesorhizobium sp. M1005]|uniref:hypothetical protein n=1 Tax=unclassified Mesorhizobium TaxID=325217 RepID=UPI00333A23FA
MDQTQASRSFYAVLHDPIELSIIQQGVIESTVGMYGDLQGIAGNVMQEIEGLEVLAIEASPPGAE